MDWIGVPGHAGILQIDTEISQSSLSLLVTLTYSKEIDQTWNTKKSKSNFGSFDSKIMSREFVKFAPFGGRGKR